MPTFRKGDRVVPSGEGRTVTWPKTPGTVTRKLSKTSVEVIWDGTSFGDEMKLSELAAAVGVKLFDAGNGRLVSVPED